MFSEPPPWDLGKSYVVWEPPRLEGRRRRTKTLRTILPFSLLSLMASEGRELGTNFYIWSLERQGSPYSMYYQYRVQHKTYIYVVYRLQSYHDIVFSNERISCSNYYMNEVPGVSVGVINVIHSHLQNWIPTEKLVLNLRYF